MLAGRSPRAVYRIYDEEEYIAGEEWIDSLSSACPDRGERCGVSATARHVAVVAMLCGGVGASVVLISCLSPATGSHRAIASLRAMAGPAVPTRLWSNRTRRVRVAANTPDRSLRHGRSDVRARTARRAPSGLSERAATPGLASAEAPSVPATTPDENRPSAEARPTAASVASQPSANASSAGSPARVEFGFEQ